MSRYDVYACKKCGGPGEYFDISLADRAGTDGRGRAVCFCVQTSLRPGEVWILAGHRPPWYAGERLREAVTA
jgi:hypothetical protein